ncbi:MAG: TonB-dependent receptor plug domain-containing protein [Odoribacter splanchnicus]
MGGTSSPAGGVDVRAISTDNIESIEVIRGIPSVEYGDLTSGAVIINSKAGREPFRLRFKTNENIYQVSAGKGLIWEEERKPEYQWGLRL